MAKNTKTKGKTYKVTVARSLAGQYVSPKSDTGEHTTVRGDALPQSKSYTFHGDRKITTSGVPIKSR